MEEWIRPFMLLAGMVVVFITFGFIKCLPELIFWWIIDIKNYDSTKFRPFGLYMFCGKQGAGKTMGLVQTLETYRKQYPKAKIYSNMAYRYETAPLTSLNDLLNKSLYNGENGTIFVIDEIQNEFSCAASKDFPETLLTLITMQRKQKIVILATSQVFTRVAKPLREQCFYVIDCFTFFGRYSRLKWFVAEDYNQYAESTDPKKKRKMRKRKTDHFVQTDRIRSLYDSYAIVERMSREGFAPKLPNAETIVSVHANIKRGIKR
jgi:ATP-dependent Clp protease ATP-binding subunit ClpX